MNREVINVFDRLQPKFVRCSLAKTAYIKPMIFEVAKKLDAPLRPEDLALLQSVLAKVCELRGDGENTAKAENHAKLLIELYQSGIRSRHQLLAMVTGKRFP